MDKKSFMRGFGTGVLFAAVILGISCLMRTSDTAVIRKARQLGMTYADSDEKLFETAAPKAKTSAAPKEEAAGASPEAGAASTEPKAVQATAKPETTAETEQKTAKATSKRIKVFLKQRQPMKSLKKKKIRSRKISINQRRNYDPCRRVVLSCEPEAGESWSGIGCEKV